MEEFDIYEDLELLHAQQKQVAKEDLKWKDKYEVALNTIQKLQAEKKELNKKVKLLETNFASLFDTARAEIKRKDQLILELRKQKDDICFRRSKPQTAVKKLNENADVRRAASSESNYVNPFSREPRKFISSNKESSEQFLDEKIPLTSSKEQLENGKEIKFDKDKANNKEHVPKYISHEKDYQSRGRQRDRSKNRSRHRDRSTERVDERSQNRFDDRIDSDKHKYRLEDRKGNRSKERSNRRDERNDDKKRKRYGRDKSKEDRSSDSSWDKDDNIHCHSQQMNYTNEDKNKKSFIRYEPIEIEEKPKDIICKSTSDHTKDQANNSKIEPNKLKNTSSSSNEQRVNPKIEILQIEILKDVKELKKNKLKAEKLPKPDPIDPIKIANEKSNQFLEALFDDSILNKAEEPSMYNDLLVSTQKTNSLSYDNNKQENLIEKDENCNINLQTPQKQHVTKLIDDLFGPSPAGSLCPVVESQNSVKSICGSSSDSDFVPIMKPVKNQTDEIPQLASRSKMPIIEQIVIDDSCSENDKSTISKKSFEMKPPKNPVNTEFTFKHQTPQKQLGTKLMDDLFGPSPGDSISGQTKSITSMDESSCDFYFEPIMKSASSRIDTQTQEINPSKVPIVISDNSENSITKNDIKSSKVKESKHPVTPSSAEKNETENIVNDEEIFKFVEFDSSFYSSEDDEIDDDKKENLHRRRVEIESPQFENITPLKNNIQILETELIGKINASKNKTEKSNSGEENRIDEKLLDKFEAKATKREDPAEKCRSTFKNKTRTDEKYYKPSFPDYQKESKHSNHSSEKSKDREEFYKKDLSKKHSYSSKHITISHNSNSRSASEENQQQHRSREEFYKKDHSKKRYNSSKHIITSRRRSNSRSASEENQHRSTNSRSEKEKHHHNHQHRHDHHRHHHEHRSKETTTHTKSDSSSHRVSRKHSKNNNDRHRSTRDDRIEETNRYLKEKSESIPEKKSISEAKSRPPKVVHYDDEPVKDLFLQLDDISDDDEIFGETSYSADECKNLSNDDDGTNNQDKKQKRSMDGQNLKSNVIEIESSDLFLLEKNKNEIIREMEELEIMNEVELNKRDKNSLESNDKPINRIIPSEDEDIVEIDIENECIAVSSEEEPQDKDFTQAPSSNVVKEIIDENSSNAVNRSDDLVEKDATGIYSENVYTSDQTEEFCQQNSSPGISDQTICVDHQLQNFEQNSDKSDFIDNSIKIQSTGNMQIEAENLDESQEQEVQKSASTNDDEIPHESLNVTDEKVALYKSSEEIQSLCPLEVDQQSHANDEMGQFLNSEQSFQSSNVLVELNKNTDKRLAPEEENEVALLNADNIEKRPISNGIDDNSLKSVERRDNFEEILNNEKPISDETLHNCLNKQINSDCQLVNKDSGKPSYDEVPADQSTSPNGSHGEENSPTITETSPNDTIVDPDTNEKKDRTTENISLCSTNEIVPSSSTTDQNVSHSRKSSSCSVSPQKSLNNSADEIESFHSNPELVSSGRRKKRKTPRKRTDVCKNTSNESIIMVSERYTKSDEVVHTEVLSKLISPDKDLGDSKSLPHYTDHEVLLGSAHSSQNNTLSIEMKPQKENCEMKPSSNDEQITEEKLNDSLEEGNEIASDKSPQEEHKLKDENKPESASKEIRCELDEKNPENNHLSSSSSSSLSGEFPQEVEKQGQHTDESAQNLSNIEEIPLSINSKILIDKDQQNTNSQIDEDYLQSSLSSSKTFEDQVKSPENVSSLELDKTKKLHVESAILIEAEREPEEPREITSNNSPPSCEFKEIDNKEDETKENSVESYSITLKRNRHKNKNIKKLAEVVETMPNEVDFDTNKIPFHGESLEEQTHNLNFEEEHKKVTSTNYDHVDTSNNETSDKTCSSSFVDNTAFYSSPLTSKNSTRKSPKQKITQHQMIKHFLDSEHTLVGICNFSSMTDADEIFDTKPKETQEKKGKRKRNTSLDNSDSEFKNKTNETSPNSEAAANGHVKRKYKKKATQILDSSHSNDDVDVTNSGTSEESKPVSNDDDCNQKKSKEMEPRKKRKYKKKNSNNSVDSTNKSDEMGENIESVEKGLDSFNSNEDVEITKSSNIEEWQTVSNDDDRSQKKSPDFKEHTKKRKYKEKNSNVNFTNKNDELCESVVNHENLSSRLDSNVEATNSDTIEESKTVPNDDTDQKKSKDMKDFKNPDLNDPPKKRKYKKKNSNNALDSTNKSDEVCAKIESQEIQSSRPYSCNSNEDIDVANSSTTDGSKTISNDDGSNQKELKEIEHFKSPVIEEPTRKQKYQKTNSNSSLDSINKNDERCESLESHENLTSLLDGSNRNENAEVATSNTHMEEWKTMSNDDDNNEKKNLDLNELPKKRKYKKKNSKNSLDSTNKSDEFGTKFESQEVHPSRLDSSNRNEGVEIGKGNTIEESISNDDKNLKKTVANEHFKSPELNESTKKRKYKKKNSNSCRDSTKSNEFSDSLESAENPSFPSQLESTSIADQILQKLQTSRQNVEIVDEIPTKGLDCHLNNSLSDKDQEHEPFDIKHKKTISYESAENLSSSEQLESTSIADKILHKLQTTRQNAEIVDEIPTKDLSCSLNNSLPVEEKEHESYHDIKHKKRKRKLSRSSDSKSEETFVQPKKSKNTLENTSQSSSKTCDITSCPASSGKKHRESQRSPSHEKSISIALTPTHHTIFLNDASPKNPPPVYNANDDDLQYHEIDDRLRCMFQSPSYTQQSNSECSFDKKNDDTDRISNENVEIDETLNQSEGTTQCETSMSSRKVSLGSSEYVIESIGSHTANVFIKRRKSKKRTKVAIAD